MMNMRQPMRAETKANRAARGTVRVVQRRFPSTDDSAAAAQKVVDEVREQAKTDEVREALEREPEPTSSS